MFKKFNTSYLILTNDVVITHNPSLLLKSGPWGVLRITVNQVQVHKNIER